MSNKDDKILIIVESPNKVKHISKILKDAGYTNAIVQASVGHIMHLKDGGKTYNSGIYPEEDFKMSLAVAEDKKKVVESLKLLVKNSNKVYLMTDADREGEVISWSLVKFLKIPESKYFRITTHEITPKAILKAFDQPRKLNMDLVNAGLVRMMIDKLIGYGLSPLGKKYIGAKSIGRCQSVGLMLITERENEINNFIPEMFFDIYLHFEKNGTKFTAKYAGTDLEEIDHLKDQKDVNFILKDCSADNFYIKDIVRHERTESPKPPFCTATFQQEAATRLGLKVKDAMSCAQKLFESGKITYMRTDSTDFAPEFIPELKQYIETNFGNSMYTKPRSAKKKDTDQDGHECLRVTDLNVLPEQISNDLHRKVYKLIWQRTIASALPNAKYSETLYTIFNNNHKFILKSNELIYKGFKEIFTDNSLDENVVVKETFNIGEKLENTSLEDVKKFTQPKPRFTEASLIKELQKREIGRPSTYATIVETILSPTRGYSELEEKAIVPTSRGMQLAAYCNRAFSNIINLNYTKEMEKSLDSIASSNLNWLEFMNTFYQDLKKVIESNIEVGLETNKEKLCPNCGSVMVMRRSRFGKLFYGCSQYPKCTGIIGID